MDAGPGIGLGHGDRVRQVQLALHLAGQDGRLIGAAQDGAFGIAQNAQTLAGLGQGRLGLIAAVCRARIVIVAGAEEDEMIVIQPVEEGHRLGDDLGINAGRMRFQMGHGLRHQLPHGPMVGGGRRDVRQGDGEAFAEAVAPLLRQRVHHNDDDGLARLSGAGLALAGRVTRDVGDRVEHGANGHAGLGQFAHDAVHEEGPVVLNDQDPVKGGCSPICPVQGAHLDPGGLTGLPDGGGGPGLGEKSREVLQRNLGCLIGVVILQRLGQKVLDQGIGLFARCLFKALAQDVEGGGGGGRGVAGHANRVSMARLITARMTLMTRSLRAKGKARKRRDRDCPDTARPGPRMRARPSGI